MKILKGLIKIKDFLFGSIIGHIIYSKQYFPEGKLFKRNKGVKWPCSPYSNVGKNIVFDNDDLNNFQGIGNYFQTWDARIHIGKGTYIASGVGIITSNHDINDLSLRTKAVDVKIGEKCWVGMNSIILPGVELGNHTIVGAGSIVTKSFPNGEVIIAGNPARIIRYLNEEG